MITRKNC